MRLEQVITLESYKVRSRWIGAFALLLLCAIPQLTSAQQPKKKIPVDIAVTEMDIQSLSDSVNSFGGQLSRQEVGGIGFRMSRPANVPDGRPSQVIIRASFVASRPASNKMTCTWAI